MVLTCWKCCLNLKAKNIKLDFFLKTGLYLDDFLYKIFNKKSNIKDSFKAVALAMLRDFPDILKSWRTEYKILFPKEV
jgi:hypothetical protein